jgi:polyphenol oxidase
VNEIWFTDRHDGNLGDRVGDDPLGVAANRHALARRLGLGEPEGWVWLHQVHGANVVSVDSPAAQLPTCDGVVTTATQLPLAVCVADCAPIALTSNEAIGALHAGWRGLEAGVVESGVAAMRAVGSHDIRALLGPCARREHYEFGAVLLDRLVARFGPEVAAMTATGAPAFDIAAAVRIALEREGIPLDDAGIDTIASRDHFSHRREGRTGRQALVVVRREHELDR